MANSIHIILAPMHGYADALMRSTLLQIGGLDATMSEFVRITHTIHSPSVWHQKIPELQQQSTIPCAVQLLGSNALTMAENALIAVACGAKWIDVNFGCPAPTVNRHSGGAALLQYPQQIETIIKTLKERLPQNIRLTAKMRLGLSDTTPAIACAQAIERGGASAVTVHARTKDEAYLPPAHWEWFSRIQNSISIPVIANGDIFSVADFYHLIECFPTENIMLGRGMLMQPDLAKQIKASVSGKFVTPMNHDDIIQLLRDFFTQAQRQHEKYALSRLKQWLPLLAKNYPQIQTIIAPMRQITDAETMISFLNQC